MSKTYTIATGNKDSTLAASEILNAGGNAYDAIIAALLMSFVTEPLLSSPGGGGYLLSKPKDKEPQLFDFFAQTPHKKDLNEKHFFPIHGDFGETQQEFHIGMAAAAVPGVPAGIFAIHENLASMPLSKLVQPAIEKAKTGVTIDEHLKSVIDILRPILESNLSTFSRFSIDNRVLKVGDVKKNEPLADFLYTFCNNPKDWFYKDQPTCSISYDMKLKNGLLRPVDFREYQVHIRKPLETHINNWQILTNSHPATGGYLITEQLKHALNNPQENDLLLIEAMEHADHLKKNRKSNENESSKGTTHMSIIDSDGNAASLTVSNGEGNGYMVPDCGFMLNNFLGEEDINSSGFFNWKENSRMTSMMSPTILSNKKSVVALGTGGSNRIKTALFQVIWHMIVENKTLVDSVNLPRFHFENDVVDIEKGINPDITAKIVEKYPNVTKWKQRSLYFGGVNAVAFGEKFAAVGDSRRDGFSLINFSKA
jgi:gamma-glutamyltranspeptidase/glutathione hydrolase